MTEADAALPELYQPVVTPPRVTGATRLAEATRIAAPVLVVAGVVMALAGLPGSIAASVVGLGVASYFESRFLHQRALRSTRFIAEENARVVALLGAGKVDDAARALDALLIRARTAPRPHAVILVLRAALFLRANDVARAKAILVAVHDSKLLGDKRTDLWNARVRSSLAMVDAANADLDAAEAWLAPLEAVDEVSSELAVARLVIAARRERYADVVDAPLPVDALGDQQKKIVAILRAFSLERSAPDGARAEEVESSLRDAGPVDPWEIDYLRSGWPTLTAFCDAHGVGRSEA